MAETNTVLLVDDDLDHQMIHATSLRYAGYDVVTAMSPAEGYGLARTEHPQLIVCDIQFDRQAVGLQLVEILAEDPLTADIPVLVYSAFTDLHDPELRSLGVPHLMKRGATHELVATVEGMLTRRGDAH